MSKFIKPALLLCFFFTSHFLLAQEKGRLEFTISEYDFGEIKEDGGPAIYEFEFENKGTVPLLISNVRASCGCTTPDWSRTPVAPGEKGFIKAQYNPRNRPGSFRKSLTITTNGDPSVVHAYIKGKVLPKMKSIEEQMPVKIGNIRLESRSVNLGRLTTETTVEKVFNVYNDGMDSLSFGDTYEAPSFIKLSFEPQKIAPKQVGKVRVQYNPVHEDNLGYNNHGIQFYTDEPTTSAKKVNILATISEYFPPMSEEESEKAPRLAISDRLQDFGKVSEGSRTEASFVLTNHGRSALNIRKVKSNCACFVAKLAKKDIKPGKSVTLKAMFDATDRKGNQNKSITIYSNDPKDPVQVISIKASVVSN